MTHPFFTTILDYPELANACRLDIMNLPEAWTPTKRTKAIILGADPTNDGVADKRGLIELDYAFGIGNKYENLFWGTQKRNLAAIRLKPEEVYVQNICRNYFKNQTTKNSYWASVATIWLPFLKEELKHIPVDVPILATAETIMKFLVPSTPKPEVIYKWEETYSFYSKDLEREVLAFYRHPQYILSKDTYPYKQYLIERFK